MDANLFAGVYTTFKPSLRENVHDKCGNVTVPTSYEYYHGIGIAMFVLLITAVIMTTAMALLYAIELYYFFKYVSPNSKRAGKLIWMAGVQPLTSIGCLIAIMVPRSAGLLDMFIVLYFARCLFSVTQLVVDFFGGRLEMARSLQGTTVRINTLPVCCCCVFLPRVNPTITVIRRIEWLVYQAAIIRPVLFIITGTITADLAGNVPAESNITTVTNVISMISTFAAMYGFILIANMSDKPLKEYCTKPLMKLTQLTIVLFNIQGGIFNILAQQGVITCNELLPAAIRAAEWNFLLLIAENFLIAIGAVYFLRPSVNATFDLYPNNSKIWEEIDGGDSHGRTDKDGSNGHANVQEGLPCQQEQSYQNLDHRQETQVGPIRKHPSAKNGSDRKKSCRPDENSNVKEKGKEKNNSIVQL